MRNEKKIAHIFVIYAPIYISGKIPRRGKEKLTKYAYKPNVLPTVANNEPY